MASNPPPIILQTGKQPSHSIIWLHGLGADGHDFVPVADELELPVAVRYVFPHAPMRPVTINGGFIMRTWYDITELAPAAGLRMESDTNQDAAGIRASHTIVETLIAKEVAQGIAPGNIILAASHRAEPSRCTPRCARMFRSAGAGALHLPSACEQCRRRADGRQQGDADLHGARPQRPDHPLRNGDGGQGSATGIRLCRGLARLRNGAHGMRGRVA